MFFRMLIVTAMISISANLALAGNRVHDCRHQRHGLHANFAHRSVHREPNRYSGDVVIGSIAGVGAWSYGGASSVVLNSHAAMPKIIDINSLAGRSQCAVENGVCVIRP